MLSQTPMYFSKRSLAALMAETRRPGCSGKGESRSGCWLSSTATRNPLPCNPHASARPTIPPPAITTSKDCILYPVRRSEEHTSELQSHHDLVCRLLLEKKKTKHKSFIPYKKKKTHKKQQK